MRVRTSALILALTPEHSEAFNACVLSDWLNALKTLGGAQPDQCTSMRGGENGPSGSRVHFQFLDFCRSTADTPICYLNHENKVQEII